MRFATDDGVVLEGELRHPDGPTVGSAVLCHPHPEHGGSKDHPFLWALRKDLAGRGFVVLAFNFRGVMGSQGTFGGGIAEVADVLAATGRVREDVGGPTIVCGWSFGAHVALAAAMVDERIAALALVGVVLSDTRLSLPPLPDPSALKGFDRPVLLLAGEADHFSPMPELRHVARSFPMVTLEVVKGADHFFRRRERDAASAVGSFASRLLSGDAGPDSGASA